MDLSDSAPVLLTYHSGNFLLGGNSIISHPGLHLSVAFEEASDIYRDAFYDSISTLTCGNGTPVQGHTTPCRTTSKVAWQHKTHGFVPSIMLFHFFFVKNCTVELLGTCSQSVRRAFTLKGGKQPSVTPEGEYLIMALFFLTFQSVVDMNTMEHV